MVEMEESPAVSEKNGIKYCVYRNSQWMELNPQTLQLGGQDAQLMVVRRGQLVLMQPEEARHILTTGDGLERKPVGETETCLYKSKKRMKRCKESKSGIVNLLQGMTSHITLLTKLMMQQRLMQPTTAIRKITFKEKSVTPEQTKLPGTSNPGEVNVQTKNISSGPESVQKNMLMSRLLEQRRKRARKQNVYREITTTHSKDSSEYCQGSGNHKTSAADSSEDNKSNQSTNRLKPSKRYGILRRAKLKSAGSFDKTSAQNPMRDPSQNTDPSMSEKSLRISETVSKKSQKSGFKPVKKTLKRLALTSSDSSDTENSRSTHMSSFTTRENIKIKSQNKYESTHRKVRATEGNKENRIIRQSIQRNHREEATSPTNTDSSSYENKLCFVQSKPIEDRVLRSANSTINDSKNIKKVEPHKNGKEATSSQTTERPKRAVRKSPEKPESISDDSDDSNYSEPTNESVAVSNSSKVRTYSTEEDHVILKYVLYSVNYKLVKGAALWKGFETTYPSSVYGHRTWQSLKNRYLRNILPNLGKYGLSLDKQKLLRAGAYAGDIKRNKKENSLLKLMPTVSASKYMMMKRREEAKKQDFSACDSPSKGAAGRSTRLSGASATSRDPASSPRRGTTSSPRRGPTSSTPVHTPNKPTPTYSQLTRRFASKKREEASSSVGSKSVSSPTKSSPGKRKLFTSKI